MTGQPLSPGQVFAGDYRIVEPLSKGGMGSVWIVEQLSTSERRALKIMHGSLSRDPKSRARFDQEARLASRIPSSHVVRVIQAGVDDATGLRWLCMELLEGEDLAVRIEREGRLDRALCATLYEQIGHALELAHKVPVVHRDLKPENVFLATPQSPGVPFTAKILDFGIAKVARDAHATDSIGSPLWMAPEQAVQGDVVTPATDVWALGLIAFRLLTGKPYWLAANDRSTIYALFNEITTAPLVPASERAKALDCDPQSLPEGFDTWFATCVARSPTDRFPEAGAARDGLLQVLGKEPPSAPVVSLPFASTQMAPMPSIPPEAISSRPAPSVDPHSKTEMALPLSAAPPSFPVGPPPPSVASVPSGAPMAAGTMPSLPSAGAGPRRVGFALGGLVLVVALAGTVRFMVLRGELRKAGKAALSSTPAESAGPHATTKPRAGCASTHACPDPIHQVCSRGPARECQASPVAGEIHLDHEESAGRYVGVATSSSSVFSPTGRSRILLEFGEQGSHGTYQFTLSLPEEPAVGRLPLGDKKRESPELVLVDNGSANGRTVLEAESGTVEITSLDYRLQGHVDGAVHAKLKSGGTNPQSAEIDVKFHAELER